MVLVHHCFRLTCRSLHIQVIYGTAACRRPFIICFDIPWNVNDEKCLAMQYLRMANRGVRVVQMPVLRIFAHLLRNPCRDTERLVRSMSDTADWLMLVDGDRKEKWVSDIVHLPLHAAWIGWGSCSSCLAFATAEASIAARLTNTVALLAPSAWCNHGFSGESGAE